LNFSTNFIISSILLFINNVYTFDLEHPIYIGKKDATKKIGVREFIASVASANSVKK